MKVQTYPRDTPAISLAHGQMLLKKWKQTVFILRKPRVLHVRQVARVVHVVLVNVDSRTWNRLIDRAIPLAGQSRIVNLLQARVQSIGLWLQSQDPFRFSHLFICYGSHDRLCESHIEGLLAADPDVLSVEYAAVDTVNSILCFYLYRWGGL